MSFAVNESDRKQINLWTLKDTVSRLYLCDPERGDALKAHIKARDTIAPSILQPLHDAEPIVAACQGDLRGQSSGLEYACALLQTNERRRF